MAPITLDMVRRRAEHNEGMVSTLEEISLHQQEIERIEGLGHICRHLKILYMQNNLVSKLENLHRLKELEYANFAVNNIRKIENLQRCESLQKLDLTVNFIDKSSLLTVHTLEANHQLRDLYLMGNPCADFGGYRAFVIGTLPQLARLDGTDVTPTERILARQALPEIAARLTRELIAEGVDVEAASRVSDARDLAPDEDDVAEIMNTPEDERPWCPATRVAEQRESARLRDAQDAERRANQGKMFNPDGSRRKPRREGFPDLPEDVEKVRQCNEGGFEFRLDENPGGDAIVLDVRVGKFVDTSLVDADVHPRVCRVLCKGKLLQLTLPEEVRPDAAVAQRSRVTGSLVVTMPKLKPPPPRKDRTLFGDDRNGDGGGGGGGGGREGRGGREDYVVGWAASGTGSDTFERRRRTERGGGGSDEGTRRLVREMGAVSIRGIVRDAPAGADLGGHLLEAKERARPAKAPATAAPQTAVYGDEGDDDEPPPL
jgi:protein TilB